MQGHLETEEVSFYAPSKHQSRMGNRGDVVGLGEMMTSMENNPNLEHLGDSSRDR